MRIIRALSVTLCLALLGGCSLLRLTYPQLPTIAYWSLDSYVDFTSTQSERVREELALWLRWNRTTQLPDYLTLIQRARAEILADTTPARVCHWIDEGLARIDSGFEQALPAAAEVARSLTPAQLDHIRKRFDKTNAELREEFVQRSPESRAQESAKRAVERAETLYGKLDDAQRERIARDMAASPFDPERWIAERQKRQREGLQSLRRLRAAQADHAQMQAALREFFEHSQRSPDSGYRAYQRRLRQHNCEFVARLHNGTTAEQRQAAAQTLAGWEADLRALAAETASR